MSARRTERPTARTTTVQKAIKNRKLQRQR